MSGVVGRARALSIIGDRPNGLIRIQVDGPKHLFCCHYRRNFRANDETEVVMRTYSTSRWKFLLKSGSRVDALTRRKKVKKA